MPPLYHRVWYWLRQRANWELKLHPTPRGIGIYVSPGMVITSLQQIAEGVAHSEWGKLIIPNKKSIVSVLKWLSTNAMITVESNAYGTVIFIVNYNKFNHDEGEKVTAKKAPAAKPKGKGADDVSPEALRLAKLLADKVLLNNPKNRELSAGNITGTLGRWAGDIDKILRLDRQDYEAVGRVIIWCQEDKFWSTVILSGKTLRDKWDKLYVGMKKSPPKESVPPPAGVEGDMFKAMQEMERRYNR